MRVIKHIYTHLRGTNNTVSAPRYGYGLLEMNQRYSSPLHTYPTSNSSHRFHSHLTPTQLVRMIMTASRSYSVCNRTIGQISGSFFCHLAKSVQADEASWSMSILSVFPMTGRRSPSQRRPPSPSVLTSYSFCKTCLKREIMIAATWRTCSSAWRMQRIELNGEEPVWLTPYLRDLQPEGEGGS